MKYLLYLSLFLSSTLQAKPIISWMVADMETGRSIAEQKADRVFYGASVTKVFVAGAALQTPLTQKWKAALDRMITVSSNPDWRNLQRHIGINNIIKFTQEMKYSKTKGYRRSDGNRTTCRDLSYFMTDTYNGHYKGAKYLYSVMRRTTTGYSKGRKYLPRNLQIADKTGSYNGAVIHPQTNRVYTAHVYHHILGLTYKGKGYSICVLSDGGSNELVAKQVLKLFTTHIKGE